MRRKLLVMLPLLAVAALAAWAALRVSRPAPEWTTDSPAALAALERGLEAERKLYTAEARGHFARAEELDHDFAAALVGLLRTSPYTPDDEAAIARRKELVARLAKVDLSRLEPREAFLVEYWLAMADGKREEALGRLEAYLAEHPSDPYALELDCEQLWAQQRFAEAERTYEKLLAVEPNWVRAQNNLGYIAMAQGRFAAAEDRFLTYRYVAPDQANPHDSLGELMLLTGRWDDARQELEKAVAVRPDFCASYVHLAYLGLFSGDLAAADAALDRAEREGRCEASWVRPQRCRVELWRQVQAGDWDALARPDASCAGELRVWPWVGHLAALQRGDVAAARALEVQVAGWAKEERAGAEARAMIAHLEGMRLVAEGRVRDGIARLEAADRELTYFGVQIGIFKLYNRMQLADALARAGDAAAAERMHQEIAAVNAPLAGSFRSGELARLHLEATPPAPPREPAAGAEEPAAE